MTNLLEKISKRKIIFFISLFLIAATIFSRYYFFWRRPKEFRPAYNQTYRLVNEKISKSAPITINLPFKIDISAAKNNIKFEPELEGVWLVSGKERAILFKPKNTLKLNRYYSVGLTLSDGGVISSDFLVVEDPEVVAIFPKENSEAPEDSKITIVFSRPMVQLTTLGYLEEKDVPVEIIPETNGKFKWISTNNLQFIPEERLLRSSRYKVKIKSGLTSIDGLGLGEKESEFATRKLRYINLTSGATIYNQPILINFNQAVDLEKTKNEISLKDNTTGKEIPFVAEYAKDSREKTTEKNESDSFSFADFKKLFTSLSAQIGLELPFFDSQNKDDAGRSIIRIYNKEDKFGRKNFWNFDTNYTLKIKKAYPDEGDIILDESGEVSISVSNPIRNISAESPRTNYASPEFFDPQGKLWIDFYEEVDLEKSKIFSSKLKEIDYDQKCKEVDYYFGGSSSCEKIPNKKRIYLIFQQDKISTGEKIWVNIEKIVNIDGLTINKEPIARELISYPDFRIVKTSPENNSTKASLTGFTICTTTPILTPSKQDYEKYFQSELDHDLKYWGSSWKVSYKGDICNEGEFKTDIDYRLMPFGSYAIWLNLEDVFGQKQNQKVQFVSGEMPSAELSFFHLQKSFNVTTPANTKLTYAVENMEYVDLEICKISALDLFYYLENSLRRDQPPSAVKNCQKVIADKIELEKKYWINNYFKIDLKDYFNDPVGHYILTLSYPDYKNKYWDWKSDKEIETPIYERTYLTITNLAVAEKRISPMQVNNETIAPLNEVQLNQLSNLYWVSDISSLEPINGATVSLYKKANKEKFELNLSSTAFTDNQGIAFADVVYDLEGVIVAKGKDSTIITKSEGRLDWVEDAYSANRFYLYTDKPIYRPGQDVFIKGIYRIGYDGNYEIYKDKKINVKVFNSRSDEILSQDLEVSDFGTFNTKIILDKNAPLGTYRYCLGEYTCGYFEVLEYAPASFEINLKTDKDEYISKDIMTLDVNAQYYFGVPLEGGEVEYTISSQNYYFDRYSDSYFDFGNNWYYQYPYSFGERFILRGKTSLDEQGSAKISSALDLEKLFTNEEDRKSKIIIIDVTVKNTQGRSISGQKSFILHSGEFYLGLNSDKSFLGKNEKFHLRGKSVDTQGKEKSVRNISINLYKLDWIYNKRQATDGSYQYRWEKKRDLVSNYKFDTDGSGNYNQELQIEKEGEYEAEISAKDNRNNKTSAVYYLYVYGEGQVNIKPTTNTELEIETQRTNLNIGDTASVIIKSPYQKAKALISVERGKIFHYEVKEIEGNLFNYNFPIQEEYLPNIYLSVLLISPKPEIKFGQIEFQINTDIKKLDISVNSNKKYYLPGEEVVLDILTRNHAGKNVSAEASIAVVDLSVLALKGNPKKNPLIFFYNGFPLTVSTASNIRDILLEIEIPTKGGGGVSEEALAAKKRGDFRETAFWQASVVTDKEGKAQVRFTLPDNLTTWQAETLAITKDTKIGTNYIEFLTRKDLMIIPLKPRFIVPGDDFYIGVQIFNQSNETQKLTVRLESGTLILKGNKAEKKITIKSGKTETLYFEVQAPSQFKNGTHKFLLSAKGEKLEDTVEQEISITPNNTYEATATSNYSTSQLIKEYVFLPENIIQDMGELKIKSSATLAVFLGDALNYLLQYPYGCSEQIASRLDSIAVVKRGLNLPNIAEKFQLGKIKYQNKEYSTEEIVEKGLAELYNNQQWDGGFSYWKRGGSDFYLTLHIIETLNDLDSAGFAVNKNSLDRAATYIYQKITNDSRFYSDNNTVILATYTLFRMQKYAGNDVLREKIITLIKNDLFINEQISNESLTYLALLLTFQENKGTAIPPAKRFDATLRNKIYATLDNRIDIDSRGAFLEPNRNNIWQYYECVIKDTALYLKAQTAIKSKNPVLDKVVRWILNNRKKDGGWGSTNNNIAVIDAFTDYLEWKKETSSNFALELLINGREEGTFEFNSKTILDQFQKEISIKDLKINENNIISFKKNNQNNLPNTLYYDMSLRYYLPADQIPPRDEGFTLTREFYRTDDKKNENPLRTAKVGNVLRGHLEITVPKSRNFVIVEDFIPAGMEIVDLSLATEQKSFLVEEYSVDREYWRNHFDRSFYPEYKEIYDDKVFLYTENLIPGVYEFDYYVRALNKGKFTHLPAMISEMYTPENFGRTDGRYFEIE